jgi:type II secretory pathway component HofQ
MSGVIAAAGEFKDAVKESVEAYDKNDLATARQSLGYASQLLAQKSAAQLSAVLPAAQSGWTVKDKASRGAGSLGIVGGIQAEREYVKDRKTVTISIMGDSPLLAQVMAVFSNPAFSGSMGKMTRINGRMAIVSDRGKLTFVVANRFVVTVAGSASDDDKQAYAKEINFVDLEKF